MPEAGETRVRRSPVRAALELLSSVRLGIVILSLLFVYMSVGSAGYVVRQMRLFEMTEYEWFIWWPFTLLSALLVLNMTVVTLRRIPFRPVNYGVWMIHAGVISLCLSSVWYFAAKVEGDTPVFRRMVVVESPEHGTFELPALPGARREIDGTRYEVMSVDPSWPILSGEHEGERAYSVSLAVVRGEDMFIRQVLDGYPQYTEDILPGSGRAVRTTGRKLVDEALSVGLRYAPQEWFWLKDTWALYVREAGEKAWTQRPIRGLPRYNDYVASVDQVTSQEALSPDPIDIPVRAVEAGDPLAGAEVRITGYLRCAQENVEHRGGGDAPNPVVVVRLTDGEGSVVETGLAALDEARSALPDQRAAILRIGDEGELADLPLRQSVGVRVTVAESGAQGVAHEGEGWVEIDGGWGLRVLQSLEDLRTGDGRVVSIAVSEIRAPDGAVTTRWVASDPAVSRDFVQVEGAEPEVREPSDVVDAAFIPGGGGYGVVFLAGPEPERLRAARRIGGRVVIEEAGEGDSFAMGHGAAVTVAEWLPRAIAIERPWIVPEPMRDPDIGVEMAMAQVRVELDGVEQTRWLRFNRWALESGAYRYGGKFAFEPETIELADGRRVELLFSRERAPLPRRVALEDFELETHVGGFSGEVSSIRDWVSHLRFEEAGGGWGEPVTIRTNEPAQLDGFRYFQAMWDRPAQARFEGDPAAGGLNFTGLGIGNREGVAAQLAACCLATFGMIYAFYIKPVIKRRARERVWSGAAGADASRGAREPERELEEAHA